MMMSLPTYLANHCRVKSVSGMALIEGDAEVVGVLRGSLTFTPIKKHARETPEPIFLYEDSQSEDELWVPRALVQYDRQMVEGEWGVIAGTPRITPYHQQRMLINQFYRAVSIDGYSPYGGILKASMGTGKTVMGILLAYVYGLQTLIIVPSTGLLTQWVERILEHTDLREKDIGIIQGKTCRYKDKPFTVGMIHTLTQKKFSLDVRRAFGTVLFDEVHLLGARTFSLAAPLFHCRYRVGLSATPRRKDGMESVFHYHIGEEVVSSTQSNSKFRVVALRYSGADTSHKGFVWGGRLNLGRYLNRLMSSKRRNIIISKAIKDQYAKGREVLVLSDRVAHVKGLQAMLQGLGVPRKQIGLYTGSQKDTIRAITLATYGAAGLGTDIPQKNVLVFATPRADIEQATGRLRPQKDNSVSLVIDIVDTASKIMLGWFGSRMKYYRVKAEEIEVHDL